MSDNECVEGPPVLQNPLLAPKKMHSIDMMQLLQTQAKESTGLTSRLYELKVRHIFQGEYHSIM